MQCTHAPYTLHAYLNTHTRAGARSPRFIHAFIYRKPSRENSARFARERRWAALPGTRVAPQPRSPSRHLYWQSPSSPPSRSRAAFRYMSILCTPLRIVFSVIRQSGVCGASWLRAGRQAQAATSSNNSGGSSDSRAGAMPGPLSRRLLLRRPPGPARCHRRRHQGRHGPRGPARAPARGEGPQGSAAERSVTPLRCALSPVPCAKSCPLCPVPSALCRVPSALSPLPCRLCPVPCAMSPVSCPLSPVPRPLSPVPSAVSPVPCAALRTGAATSGPAVVPGSSALPPEVPNSGTVLGGKETDPAVFAHEWFS